MPPRRKAPDWSQVLPRPIKAPKGMLVTLGDVRRFLLSQPKIAEARWSASAGAVLAAVEGRGELADVRREVKLALRVSQRR